MYVHKESDNSNNSNNNDCATPDRCSAVFSCAACFVLDKVLFLRVCLCAACTHTYMHMCVKESAQSRVGEAQLCHFVRDFHSVNEKGKAKVFSAAATKGGSFLFRLGV